MAADAAPAPAAPPGDGGAERGFVRQVGRRNLAYGAFVALLIPFGLTIEALGPGGPDAGDGVAAAMLLWLVVSVGFLVANAVLLVLALRRGQKLTKPLIACVLPFVGVLFLLSVEATIGEALSLR